MKRKIVKQGAATLMVSLPAKWAKSQGLDKGDEIDITEEGNKLILATEESQKREQKSKIDVTNYTPLVNRVLVSLYIRGIDELEVTFQKPEEVKLFQKQIVNELLGFEILKQTNNSMLLKDVTGADVQQIDDIIKRIFFILNSMIEEFVQAVEKKESLEPIIEIDTSVNKFVNFCLRILNKQGYSDNKKTPLMYGIVSLLEEIADVYKKLAKEIEATKIKMDKEQLEVLADTRKSLQVFESLLKEFKKEKAVEFAGQYEKIKKKIKSKNKIDFLLLQLNETIIKMNNYLLVMSA